MRLLIQESIEVRGKDMETITPIIEKKKERKKRNESSPWRQAYKKSRKIRWHCVAYTF